jgi:RNA polymerase sigma factor (sigma-70 family)
VRERPRRSEIDPVALDLVSRHGPKVLATARRYAITPEDAEDAYQRALEILLTKAPSTDEADLVPWLKTVVKHEAFALRRQRDRHGTPSEHDDLVPAAGESSSSDERAERLERLHLGAEALGRLKPQEVRCLLLRAEGFSYRQICKLTGFSYTKVNRCLSEGRRSFMDGVRRIESGAECERLAPLVSRLADGEATADDMSALRPHLRSCLACRAMLREYRAAPRGLAAAVPAAALGGTGADPIAAVLHALVAWLHERGAAIALRIQQLLEGAGAHKLAAAASSAALAGGGVAAVETIDGGAENKARPASAQVQRVAPTVTRQSRPRDSGSRRAGETRSSPATVRVHRSSGGAEGVNRRPDPRRSPPASNPEPPGEEFTPETGEPGTGAGAARSQRDPGPDRSTRPGGDGAGGGEFGP